jgi:hypothetical protein
MRGKLLEVAAALDRVARAEGSVDDDPRMRQIRQSLQVLCAQEPVDGRAEQVQMAFSLDYDPRWRERMMQP